MSRTAADRRRCGEDAGGSKSLEQQKIDAGEIVVRVAGERLLDARRLNAQRLHQSENRRVRLAVLLVGKRIGGGGSGGGAVGCCRRGVCLRHSHPFVIFDLRDCRSFCRIDGQHASDEMLAFCNLANANKIGAYNRVAAYRCS